MNQPLYVIPGSPTSGPASAPGVQSAASPEPAPAPAPRTVNEVLAGLVLDVLVRPRALELSQGSVTLVKLARRCAGGLNDCPGHSV